MTARKLQFEEGDYIELIPTGGWSLPPEDTVAMQATMGVGGRPRYFTYEEWLTRKDEQPLIREKEART